MSRETLEDRHERALTLSQRGYSSSGIAKKMDVTEQTAQKYLDEIEEVVGVKPLIESE